MSAFSFQTLVDTSVFWLGFEEYSFRICFKNSSLSTCEKEKGGCCFPLDTFPSASMLG